jgi:hypothetical protein
MRVITTFSQGVDPAEKLPLAQQAHFKTPSLQLMESFNGDCADATRCDSVLMRLQKHPVIRCTDF